MNWLDLAIFLFLIIFIIIGIRKGFMSSILSNFTFGVNALISFFLCKPISFVYNKWFGVGNAISSSYKERLLSSSDNFAVNLLSLEKAELNTFVKDTINSGNMSGFEKSMFRTFINKSSLYDTLQSSGHTSRSLADIISSAYSHFFVTIIAFVTSIVLVYLVVLLFRLLVNKLREHGFIKAVDNIFGAVYGVFRCLLCFIGICFVIKLISPLSFMKPVTNYISQSFSGNLIYSQINTFLDNYLNFNDIITFISKK